jgi:arsenate-mycothiol transferase
MSGPSARGADGKRPGSGRPAVLFICSKNGGKSPMAEGLMRQLVGDRVEVASAGTKPGAGLNELSVAVMREVDVDISHHVPQRVTPELLRTADRVITLGGEARVDPVDGVVVENWHTDEPSERGIEGIDRMRLVRDDIAARVRGLAAELRIGRV